VKGVQTIEYDVTLDIYSSTEAIEYETFGHEDSKYAVKAYYALIDNSSTMMTSSKVAYQSYDHMKENFVEGKIYSDDMNTFGMDMPVDEWFEFNKLGESTTLGHEGMPLAYWDTYNAGTGVNLRNLYGYADNTELQEKFSYLAIDCGRISTTSPIESYVAMDTALNIYVTPRHTQEYYELYSGSTLLKYSYTVPFYKWTDSEGVTHVEGNHALCAFPIDVENGVASYTKPQVWAPWFYGISTSTQTITIQTIADNYEAFAANAFPMMVIDRPQGWSTANHHNGFTKLGSLVF